MKTETFDKKSLEKLRPGHQMVVGANPYNNGGDSTEDVMSSKQ